MDKELHKLTECLKNKSKILINKINEEEYKIILKTEKKIEDKNITEITIIEKKGGKQN